MMGRSGMLHRDHDQAGERPDNSTTHIAKRRYTAGEIDHEEFPRVISSLVDR